MTATTMSLAELQDESVELLPARETLCCWRSGTDQSQSSSGLINVNNVLNNNQVNVLSFGNDNSGNSGNYSD